MLALSGAAGAAVTQYNAYGTTLLDGNKVFPIVLAKGPERDGVTPSGSDALDDVVGAGVNFFKVGPASRPWWPEDKADALAWDQEAAARGAYTWVNLATLADAEPGKLKDTRLREVISLLENDPSASALAMWKGADEPWWGPGFLPSDLQYAYCVATSRGDPGWCAGQPAADSDHLWVTIQAPRGTASDLEDRRECLDISNRTAGRRFYLNTARNSLFFQHAYSIRVRLGQRVRRGHYLGTTLGGNGSPHLHLGVQRGTPYPFIGCRGPQNPSRRYC